MAAVCPSGNSASHTTEIERREGIINTSMLYVGLKGGKNFKCDDTYIDLV